MLIGWESLFFLFPSLMSQSLFSFFNLIISHLLALFDLKRGLVDFIDLSWRRTSSTIGFNCFDEYVLPGELFVTYIEVTPSKLNLTQYISVVDRRYGLVCRYLNGTSRSCYQGWSCYPDSSDSFNVISNLTLAQLNYSVRLGRGNLSQVTQI